jgi:hypothetical protein
MEGITMRSLNDETLVVCYLDSLKLQLDEDFIDLLTAEMNNRNLQIPSQPSNNGNKQSTLTLQDVR